MIKICETNKCTGCAACVNACVRQCIKLDTDKYGELHPIIDEDKCIDCGLCQKVCPNNSSLDFKTPHKCLASWIENAEKRKKCASGGIGTMLSEFVLTNGGVIFGSRYDDNMNPVMSYTENMVDLDYYKGSRYVQSVVGDDTFKNVLRFLKEGRTVLFIGTPCQVAGLLCYLRKPYDNLITIDLICHGVCPSSYLKEEVNFLSRKCKIKDIADIRFRGNDGNNFRLTLWDKDKRKLFPRNSYFQKITYSDESQQYYIKGFLLGVTMRENCYSCKYARPDRISDITIGDFIGLGKTVHFDYSPRNVSAVLLNSKKGEDFYHKVSENNLDLKNFERNYSERLNYKPSLVHPFERHPLNSSFKELYLKEGYVKAIRIVLNKELRKERIEYLKRMPIVLLKKPVRPFYRIIKTIVKKHS